MPGLSLQLLEHQKVRIVQCCLCGREWEEHWFAVVLAEAGGALGSVCPACVKQSPRETAAFMRRESARLAATLEPLQSNPLPGECDALWLRVRRVRAETQRLCAAAQGLIERGEELRVLATERAQELGEVSTVLREHLQRAAALRTGPTLEASADLVDDAERASAQARALSLLADYLSGSEPWPISVRAAIDAERRLFAQHLPEFGELEARLVVDERYERFLTRSA